MQTIQIKPYDYQDSSYYNLFLINEGFLSIERHLDVRVQWREDKIGPILKRLEDEQAARVLLSNNNLFAMDGLFVTAKRKLNEAATAAAAAYWQVVPFNERQARIEQLLSEISL